MAEILEREDNFERHRFIAAAADTLAAEHKGIVYCNHTTGDYSVKMPGTPTLIAAGNVFCAPQNKPQK